MLLRALLVPRSDEAAKMQRLAGQSPDVLHVACILRRHRHVHGFGIRIGGSLYDANGKSAGGAIEDTIHVYLLFEYDIPIHVLSFML
jgi:hypothetical protein